MDSLLIVNLCLYHFLHDRQSKLDSDAKMLFLVLLYGHRFWVVCADMAAQYTVPDPANPGKMFMNYQGLASYLSSGGEAIVTN